VKEKLIVNINVLINVMNVKKNINNVNKKLKKVYNVGIQMNILVMSFKSRKMSLFVKKNVLKLYLVIINAHKCADSNVQINVWKKLLKNYLVAIQQTYLATNQYNNTKKQARANKSVNKI